MGTAAAVLGSSAGIPPDLESRSRAALEAAHLTWATVDFDMRDAVLRGIAPSAKARDAAVMLVAEVSGVRSVTTDVKVIDTSDVFLFRADFDGTGLRLSGGVKSAGDLAVLTRAAGVPVTSTATANESAPDGFIARATALVSALALLEKGQAMLTADRMVLSGVAENAAARDAAAAGLKSYGATVEITLVDPPAPYTFSATKSAGGQVVLRGFLPTGALRTEFQLTAGSSVQNESAVRADAPQGFEAAARAGLAALRTLSAGSLSFGAEGWKLSGMATDEAGRTSIRAALGVLPAEPAWTVSLGVPAVLPPVVPAVPKPAETVSAPAVATESTPEADSTDAEADEVAAGAALRTACATSLASLSADNAILFKPGSAVLLDSSVTEIDALVTVLKSCPDAAVNVEGHTDGDGDPAANLDLSVARAEAVIGVLVEKGVAPERLYAVGYGETQPVGSNDTKAGKQANRRIAFSLVEPEASRP